MEERENEKDDWRKRESGDRARGEWRKETPGRGTGREKQSTKKKRKNEFNYIL